MKRFLMLMLAGAAIITGCSAQGSVSSGETATSAPAPEESTELATPTEVDPPVAEDLTIKVVGTCADNGRTGMRLDSTGFTPNGQYQSTVTYPDGKPYTHLLNGGKGRADKTGATPDWEWNCYDGDGNQADPPGVYRLRVVDSATGYVATTTFVVSYDE